MSMLKNFKEGDFKKDISSETMTEKTSDGFSDLADFIEKEYFVNFLNIVDQVEDKSVFAGIKDKTGVDVLEMKAFIDEKIPPLLEKIKMITQDGQMQIIVGNSFRDILGNSITIVFNRIIWLVKNFNSENPKHKEGIENPDSMTRKVISSFSKEAAVYYIDNLCQNDERLRLELTTPEGYLKNFKKYFLIQPTGSKKAVYFRFFSELEKNGNDITKLTAELEKINDFEEKIKINFLDKEQLVNDFGKGALIF
ncbi:MAG: hypothetical protein UR66_C0007G0042 [Candidatus Moranbacteria bacterium GW2011_GWE1_35_17]|nr:MAG: hypothetical protein UR66_C0007G0042 [Candidatus Moranbacteria bacterium GW2011_GWE1_35_17]KKP71794.1 MAG: hypothetical protein UR65_C0026G0005 [Candidatus Moranbacteria bacterium GW2011_GWE2_35_164]KKP81481.1 MAG: hypothetical protein UR82_C0060G0003 [Candidatus Moranbacteria bacterium GW2011_GWF1_35_5]KKP84517.1 MAG: hypothetical protein UR83_C0019G0010 [Candidatus Moranbacteria bacterium GW2011_GWF2_35_54]